MPTFACAASQCTQPDTHIATLRVRDASGTVIGGTTSFGILLALAFAGLALLCVFGGSTYRRMRMLQARYPIPITIQIGDQGVTVHEEELAECPQIWDCYVPSIEKGSWLLHGSDCWEQAVPITASVIDDPNVRQPQETRTRRLGGLRRNTKHSNLSESARANLEVATLIAMPSPAYRIHGPQTYIPESGADERDLRTASGEESWARHVIGITRVAYGNS